MYEKDGSRISFIIQYHDQATCEWKNINKTLDDSIGMSSLPIFLTGDVVQSCTVRVCLTTKPSLRNKSCSEPRRITSSKLEIIIFKIIFF